ncbi:MAG: HAMP domain-containing protein [Candidatus Aminicenantes bacterium]|nr:HAMP domain-containing protein [Candidatus Aminicenantes bacterium]
MSASNRKGPRFIGAVIILLILLFFAIELFIRESQEFSPTSVTDVLLSSLQIIVLLLFLIFLLILGRYLIKLNLERKRKVAGSHFKTKLVLFFILLSFIPTVLLFFFASDLISRNIEMWFKTPLDKILEDTKGLADGVYARAEEEAYHYALELSRDIRAQKLVLLENRLVLREFIRAKLAEYRLDEIGIFLGEEELYTYLSPDLPLQNYKSIQANMVARAQLGEVFRSIEPMGNGEMVRRGVSFSIPGAGNFLVTTGRFFPQSYAQKINSINSYVQRYRLFIPQKVTVKTFYVIVLMFVTVLIVFAASWIGFHLAKGITVPIEKLAAATKEVSQGNLEVRVEDPASDELGALIDSFNQMIFDLKRSQEHIAQKTSELENRKQYIETILNNITTGVITLDARGIITTINPSAREMLSLGEQDPLGKSFQEVLSDTRYGDIVKNIDWGLKNKYALSDKEINIVANGQMMTLALALSPLHHSDGDFSGMIVVLDNLTQLIKAQKIAAWKEVAQMVAHEIKNPLTPIQLSAERIIKILRKNDRNSQAVVEEGARTIIQEARTIKSLVDEFSNFARLPKVALKPANLRSLIDQTVSLFRGIFTQVEFEIDYGRDIPPTLQLDPEQMKRVFINLIDNAIEAMNKKGKIKMRVWFEKKQQRVMVEVSDTGPGISVEDKAKLFLPYFSTKKKGTGLGLAIVSQIIREHNGAIQAENNSPSGAKFIIQLPA